MEKSILLPMLRNDHRLYSGDGLEYYYRIIFGAPNINAPYHNFRHMLNVTCEVYEALLFYADRGDYKIISEAEMDTHRALLIAALFHDYGHKGVSGNDWENIAVAKQAVSNYILPEDKRLIPRIHAFIDFTEFPHKEVDLSHIPHEISFMNLYGHVLREADAVQVFSFAWMQSILFGLGSEMGKTPIEMLHLQLEFIPRIHLASDWAKSKFSEEVIDDRLVSVQGHLELLEEK